MNRIALRSLLCFALGARAETNEIRAAQQYGLSYLALMLMEDGKLVEKHAKQAGLPELKVTWAKLGGPQPMNVKGVGALNDMPNELIVGRPEVKSIRDLGAQDKIAVTSVKISTQALLLQMAAAKEWGDKEYEKLDSLTVSMSHPDSLTALLSGSGAISGHFASPPFSYQEKAKPPLHAILNSYDILGGQATFNVVWSSSKFHDANPTAYKAFSDAFQEATDAINKDKRAAAETYKRMTKTTESIESLMQMMNDPKIVFTLEPHRMMTTADFMHRIGRIKVKPLSWKDLFFENVHSLKGS